MKRIAKAAGVKKEDILGHDLFLYTREKGRILGENGEFVMSPRLDDLQCAFAAVKAMCDSAPTDYINVCAVFDNEEVGSRTRQGADSTFLEDVVFRIGEALGKSRGEYLQLVAGSFMISADNAHAVHPNHPEKADPTNKPYLNGGIVIKFHGSQKYATDAVSAAKLKDYCERAHAPFQSYANRSDIPGGSTLGNLSQSHVSLASADIGLPQLAMHSAVETAGARDTKYAVDMFRVFYGE
jgi:aspartyl aminopeptidase